MLENIDITKKKKFTVDLFHECKWCFKELAVISYAQGFLEKNDIIP